MNATRTQNYRDPARWNTVPVPERVAERAHSKWELGEGGCWISTYSIASHGYSQIGWKAEATRHMVLGHRASWAHVNGQVPMGMTLDHTCKVRRCVNPAHLRLLPNFENARRNQGDDWEFGTCRNGHPNTELEDVSRPTKGGGARVGVQCRTCARDWRKRWEERNVEKMREGQRVRRARKRAEAEALPAPPVAA